MEWVNNYSLFLFDFDGLLVDTERAQYGAYCTMCRERGFDLPWDFRRYLELAHYSATGVKQEMYALFPDLYRQEPKWEVLHAEKKRALLNIYREGKVGLMPGVEKLLLALERKGIPRAVVTHSDDEQVMLIRGSLPILNTIPHWITRHDYNNPKPDPECYRTAIKKLAKPGDPIIGFEDSPRGLKALMGTEAQPVLVTTIDYPEIDSFKKQGALHYPTFESIASL